MLIKLYTEGNAATDQELVNAARYQMALLTADPGPGLFSFWPLLLHS
jgi:hypothetical protein